MAVKMYLDSAKYWTYMWQAWLLVACVHLSHAASMADWSGDMSPEKWNRQASETLNQLLNKPTIHSVAKNLILFIGDGMGISSITAGRIRKGQQNGQNGEETITYMESMPDLALSKTYNINAQTADSAGTGTAYLCGVKTRAGIIGLSGHAITQNCSSTFGNELDSILKWAKQAGKSVGIVTTTRITHATPASAYANVAFREWEAYDGKRFTAKQSLEGCKDIAAQLIDNNHFIDDYSQISSKTGNRADNRHLINEWQAKMTSLNKTHKFIWNASDFRSSNLADYEHVLALLAIDHLSYEVDRVESNEPSIREMTLKAIQMLSRNKNGYFLLVEGGRIDHGHHDNKAHKALDDFVAFDDAIGGAREAVSDSDTSIVVTADHSHTFTIGGNGERGNSIYGIANQIWPTGYYGDSNLTFTSLLYGNGPGGLTKIRTTNLTNEQTENKEYVQEAVVYKKMASHGGEDVAIFASGPMSFLFTSTVEQNFIPHAMAYAACIGPYTNNDCYRNRGSEKSSGSNIQSLRSTETRQIVACCLTILASYVQSRFITF